MTTDLLPVAAREDVGDPGAGALPGASRTETGTLGTWSARLRPLVRPTAFYVASRAAMTLVVLVASAFVPGFHPVHALATAFDGRWYLDIAQHGYPAQLVQEGDGDRWAFFPAFPLAARATAAVTGLGLPAAALAAAWAFGLSSAVAVWLAVREVCGSALADRAVLLYVFCPTAYVLSLAYTEGLFLTAAALCLFALSRHAWAWAGVCACVAGLTRSTGAVVVVAVLVTAAAAAWRERRGGPLVGAAVAPLGLVAFVVFGWARAGSPLAFLAAERFWHGQHFVWFLTPVLAGPAALAAGPSSPAFTVDLLAAAALVVGFLGLRWLDRMSSDRSAMVRPVPGAWWIFTVGALLVAYSAYFPSSIPRYAMAAFPLFAAVAWRLRGWVLGTTVVVAGLAQAAMLLDVLGLVHATSTTLIP